MTTHIGKMLGATAAVLHPPQPDGVYENAPGVWGVRHLGAVICLLFGDPAEAKGHLIQLQGGEVPPEIVRRIHARRAKMATLLGATP